MFTIIHINTPLNGSSQKNKPNIIKDKYRTYYEIFVGTFSDSNNDGIGDFKGLLNRLDYLNDGNPKKGNDLGIDGIWLMPIMQANSYHKYDVMDYCSIDKEYGTMQDFDNFRHRQHLPTHPAEQPSDPPNGDCQR